MSFLLLLALFVHSLRPLGPFGIDTVPFWAPSAVFWGPFAHLSLPLWGLLASDRLPLGSIWFPFDVIAYHFVLFAIFVLYL